MGLNIKEIFSSIFKKESFKKEVLGENPSKSKRGAWETYNVSLNSNVEALAKTFKEAERVVRNLRDRLSDFFSEDKLRTIWINKPFFEEHKEFHDYIQALSVGINKHILEESFWDTMAKHLSAHYLLSQVSGFVGRIYIHLNEKEREKAFEIAVKSRDPEEAANMVISFLRSTGKFTEDFLDRLLKKGGSRSRKPEEEALDFSSVVGCIRGLCQSFEGNRIRLKAYCDELCKVVELIRNVHDSAIREKVDSMYRNIYNRFYQEFYEGGLAGKSEKEIQEHWEWLKSAVHKVVERFDKLIEKAEVSIYAGVKRGIHDYEMFKKFKIDFESDWNMVKGAAIEVIKNFAGDLKEFVSKHIKIDKIATDAQRGKEIVYNVYERSSLFLERVANEVAGKAREIEESDEKFLKWLGKAYKDLGKMVKKVEEFYDKKVSQKIRKRNFRIGDLRSMIRDVVKEVMTEHEAEERHKVEMRDDSRVKKEQRSREGDGREGFTQNQGIQRNQGIQGFTRRSKFIRGTRKKSFSK